VTDENNSLIGACTEPPSWMRDDSMVRADANGRPVLLEHPEFDVIVDAEHAHPNRELRDHHLWVYFAFLSL